MARTWPHVTRTSAVVSGAAVGGAAVVSGAVVVSGAAVGAAGAAAPVAIRSRPVRGAGPSPEPSCASPAAWPISCSRTTAGATPGTGRRSTRITGALPAALQVRPTRRAKGAVARIVPPTITTSAGRSSPVEGTTSRHRAVTAHGAADSRVSTSTRARSGRATTMASIRPWVTPW